MPRFNARIEFDLATEIEPEFYSGVGDESVEGVSEYSDESSFYRGDLSVTGGEVLFVVEAPSEEEAEEIAAQVVEDGNVVDDSNGIGWEIQNVTISVEEIETPMDTERAKVLVTEYLDQMEGMDDELKLAFQFLLELVTVQREDIRRAEQRVASLTLEVESLRPLAETAADLSGTDAA